MGNSETKALDGGEFDALPSGIYNLKPHMYPDGYLTYTNEGVTGRGTTPGDPDCRWTLSNPVENKQWIRTPVSNATNPYLSIEDNALLTAPHAISLPSSYYFRALDVRSDETDTGPLVREEEPQVKKFQSDVDQSQYIGVDGSGFVVPPSFAGSNPEYVQFTTTDVMDFSPASNDLDLDQKMFKFFLLVKWTRQYLSRAKGTSFYQRKTTRQPI
ncbi:uncharacterized protein [Oscarella lobularis]|uniref:uncharacterized protein n=1 Tax=Oscarella lobularis TaxID=121494 RepID=UPI003313930E